MPRAPAEFFAGARLCETAFFSFYKYIISRKTAKKPRKIGKKPFICVDKLDSR